MATQAECARWLRLSERRFRELVDEGVITKATGKGGYELETVVGEYVENLRQVAAGRGGDIEQKSKATEEARRQRLMGDKLELEVDEMRGSLVPIGQIARAWHSIVIILKTRLNAIPAKVAPLVGAPNPAHAETVIREQIHEALAELSRQEVRGPAATA